MIINDMFINVQNISKEFILKKRLLQMFGMKNIHFIDIRERLQQGGAKARLQTEKLNYPNCLHRMRNQRPAVA